MVVINESKIDMADSIAAATMAAANLASRAGVTSASMLKSTVDITRHVGDKDSDKPIYPRLFNKIVLTLENSLIPVGKLDETPSHQDGLNAETEKDLRILGCELIQTAGILLKLPQVAMATGQVLFQRFFYSKSFVRHNMETVAMSCLCLASKIEEAPRRIRDVINVFHHIKQVRAQKEIMPMVLDQVYTNLKTQVIKAERRVLKELGFCVHVKHPHKLIVMYLQVLKYESHQKLMQMSWNFMNDSLRTDVFMRYNPETIACACIYLSARKLAIPLPKKPQWFRIFRVHENDIIDICYRVMELYVRAKPNMEKLEAAVDELKKKYMESRTKTKEQQIQQQQPVAPAVTTVDRNDTSHNAWGGFIQRAIPLPLPEKSPADRRSQSRTRSRSRTHSRSRSRSHSRSRTRSASPRGRKKAHRRTRSRSNSTSNKTKKKSRRYSDSSLSPSQSKHHRRKASRERDRDRDRERERDRDRDRERERDRDRERERDRERNRDRYEYSSHHSSKHHRSSYNSHRSSYNSSRGSNKQHESDRSRDRKR